MRNALLEEQKKNDPPTSADRRRNGPALARPLQRLSGGCEAKCACLAGWPVARNCRSDPFPRRSPDAVQNICSVAFETIHDDVRCLGTSLSSDMENDERPLEIALKIRRARTCPITAWSRN